MVNNFWKKLRKYLIAGVFFLIALNAFSGEISHPDYTLVYRMDNDSDVQAVFNIVKEWIAKNNHYNCTIKTAEEINKDAEIFIIGKPRKNEMFNYTIYQCLFYSKGVLIELFLSDNEAIGFTRPYSANEREAVFERFHQLYRWNVLGIE